MGEEPWAFIGNLWIEIRFRVNGIESSRYVITNDKGQFELTLPDEAAEAFFREIGGSSNAVVLLYDGQKADDMVPLWTQEEFTKFVPVKIGNDCLLRGRVLKAPTARAAVIFHYQMLDSFDYQLLQADEHFFQTMPVEDMPLAPLKIFKSKPPKAVTPKHIGTLKPKKKQGGKEFYF